ncbi:MAG: hypothetical protein Q9199_007079 [Rusavskia elegans]
MLLFTIITFAVATVAAPFPLPDGFPNPNYTQLLSIEKLAGGFLPNYRLPTSLSKNATTALQLLAHNEIFEVAFFNQLLTNITTAVPGYGPNDTAPLDRAQLIKNIEAIKNQEELHSIAANQFLVSAKQQPIAPCQYTFPVSNFKTAMLFAQVFTDLALGTIPTIQLLFAGEAGGASRNVLTLGSILGQEGQQDGFFRSTQRKTPSAAPFLTLASASIASNILEKLIVKDSCPQPLSDLGYRTLPSLSIDDEAKTAPEAGWPNWISISPRSTKPSPQENRLSFTVVGLPRSAEFNPSITYLSGAGRPYSVTVWEFKRANGSDVAHFFADRPLQTPQSNGLTIALFTRGLGPYTTTDAALEVTSAGPVLIEQD